MLKFLSFLVVFVLSFSFLANRADATSIASASVVARIDISQQKMRVYVNGAKAYVWRISSGRKGYWTPRGSYRPGLMKRMHYSKKYYNSPMPWSIFFKGGYAIHGTNAIKRLGRPASHGCIRLHPSAARRLYSLMRRNKGRSRIVITN